MSLLVLFMLLSFAAGLTIGVIGALGVVYCRTTTSTSKVGPKVDMDKSSTCGPTPSFLPDQIFVTRAGTHTSIWALRVLALLREERPNMICACIAQTTSHTSLKTPAKDHQKKSKSKSHIIRTSLTETGGDLVFVESGVMFGRRESRGLKVYQTVCSRMSKLGNLQNSKITFYVSWQLMEGNLQPATL